MSVFTNKFSEQIAQQKYYFGGESSMEEVWRRVAKAVAAVEKKPEDWEESFYGIMEDFAFVPGGRILSNAGLQLKSTTLCNCIIDGFVGTDQDSIKGIYDALYRQAAVLKSEAGYGFCCDVMRPRGAHISGIANQTPGPVKFLELWDKSSEVLTAGSGEKSTKKEKVIPRKGAMMVTCSMWHPDIEAFITAKNKPHTLTKFNMSVLAYDAFMQAVELDANWILMFPDYEQYPDLYREYWDGNLQKWMDLFVKNGQVFDFNTAKVGDSLCGVKVYKILRARDLFELIMTNVWNRGEPGVMFPDTINAKNNLWYCEFCNSSNPCLAEGTLVNTPNGYRKIEDIKEGDYICTLTGIEPVSKVHAHRDIPTFLVKFSDGGEQIVTPHHQYHVIPKGSKSKKLYPTRLCELKVGDTISVESCYINKINDSELSRGEYTEGLKAGILLGDGCYTQDRIDKKILKIASSQEDTEYNQRVKTIFGEEYFNKDDIDTKSKSMSMHLRLAGVNLEKLGLSASKASEKSISYSRINNFDFAIGLLDGLLATDGNVNLSSNHPQIRWDTSSLKLAQTIRNILLYIGCHGFLTTQHNKKGGTIGGRIIKSNGPAYTITISGFSFKNYAKASNIGLVHKAKQQKINMALCQFKVSGNSWKAKIKSITAHKPNTVYDLYCKDSDTWITSGYVQRGCSEQIGHKHLICLLASLNLTQFVNLEKKTWDYPKLKSYIATGFRFMDNVNDIINAPLPEEEEDCKNKRRIGMGVFGYGSALYMLGLEYGSQEAIASTEELMSFIANEQYRNNALLAKEKGSFLLFDREKYLQSKYIQSVIRPEIQELISKYGARCSHCSSCQPTGNTGCLSNNVSTGVEPIFAPIYTRTYIIAESELPANLKTPEYPDFKNKKCKKLNGWKWTKEGDTHLLKIEHNGEVYKQDLDRGFLKEEIVRDYAVQILGDDCVNSEWAVTAQDLTVDAHIDTLATFAKYIDAAISKTQNIPKDYPYEDFKESYFKAWKKEIKGYTCYREGTMTNVLKKPDEIEVHEAPERPNSLNCEIFTTKSKGESYFVLVGLLEESPYEVFAGKCSECHVTPGLGKIVKRKKGVYDLQSEDGGDVVTDICSFLSDNEEAITRLVSTNLRFGTKLSFVVEQLEKTKGEMHTFGKALARILKKYIPDGTKSNEVCPVCNEILVRESGCLSCKQGCGYSACV